MVSHYNYLFVTLLLYSVFNERLPSPLSRLGDTPLRDVLASCDAGRPFPRVTLRTRGLCATRVEFLLEMSLHLSVLVGPSGLEPPTSCLSGTRSNLLSYEPIRFAVRLPHDHGGDDGTRTHDPLLAKQVLSQLSYTPL